MSEVLKSAAELREALGALEPDYPTIDDQPSYNRAMRGARNAAKARESSGDEVAAHLARTIHAVLEGIAAGSINPAYAVPLLVSAAELLFAEPKKARTTALEAARYELETLLPPPGARTKTLARFDVPSASLNRKPRSKT